MFGDILVSSMSVVYTFQRLRLLAPDRSGVLPKHSVRPNHRTLRQRWPRTCLPKPGKTVRDFASTPIGGSSPWNFRTFTWENHSVLFFRSEKDDLVAKGRHLHLGWDIYVSIHDNQRRVAQSNDFNLRRAIQFMAGCIESTLGIWGILLPSFQ